MVNNKDPPNKSKGVTNEGPSATFAHAVDLAAKPKDVSHAIPFEVRPSRIFSTDCHAVWTRP